MSVSTSALSVAIVRTKLPDEALDDLRMWPSTPDESSVMTNAHVALFTAAGNVTSVNPANARSAVMPPVLASTVAVVPVNPIRAQYLDAETPAGPVAPTAPFEPGVPAGPVAPTAPAGPVAPVGPAAPCAPCGPCGPCGPRLPFKAATAFLDRSPF